MRDRTIGFIIIGLVSSSVTLLLWFLSIDHDCRDWAINKAPLAQFSLEDHYYRDCLAANNVPTFPSITLPAEN